MIEHEYVLSALSYDTGSGVFTRKRRSSLTPAGGVVGCKARNGYLVINLKGKTYLAHRLAFFYVTGRWPSGEIDHADGNKENNAFANLRECTKSQNMFNIRARPSRSGAKNVEWHNVSGMWRVRLFANGKKHHIGYYRTVEEASKAATIARDKLHGEFARHA